MSIDVALVQATDSVAEGPAETPVYLTDQSAEFWLLLRSLPPVHSARVDARNALVDIHMPLVRHLVRRYVNRGEPLDDLVQVGAVGLIKAIERFEPERGLAFSTFAIPTITGEIKRHFRDKTWMVRPPRPLQEMRARLVRAREELSQQLNRSPTIPELAEYMRVGEDAVLEGLEAANAYSAVSINGSSSDETSVAAAIEGRLGVVDEGMDLVERRSCVTPLLDALPERDRRIIFLRFFREMTQTEIATELGLSQMHVSRLLSQILGQLQGQLISDSQG